MDDAPEFGHLNSSQRLHLLTSCQYADKLLSEIEATLVIAVEVSLSKIQTGHLAGTGQSSTRLHRKDAGSVGAHPG